MTLLLSVAAVAAGCSSDLDCALSGDCVKGACKCDPGWKTPPLGGTACSAFDLQPALASRPGYRNVSWPSWGGHPVQWRKEDGGDGKWHLFTPQFTNECDVDEWIHNSFIVHAVGEGPRGPWSGGHDVAIPVWAHGSQAVRDPVDGQWLLFFVGGWHYQSDVWQRCNADNATIPWPVEPAGPGLGPVGDCGPKQNAGCGIRVASSASPFGPWTISEVKFSGDATPDLLDGRSDPAPYILPNGTMLIAFGSGSNGLETIGVARASRWNATFVFTSGKPIADVATFQCPTGQLAEDANLWWDGKRGWHIIAHDLCSWHRQGLDNMTDNYAMHAYSRDGVEWHVATDATTGRPSLAWSKRVTWSNGSTTYISRMERPQVVLDPKDGTTPIYLTTAVCVGGMSVGGTACTDRHGVRHKSWDLYREIRR